MAIEYKRILGDDRTFLTEEVRVRLEGEKKWGFAAWDTDEESWCAYAVVSMADGASDLMQIHEVYVEPHYRRDHIGSGLFSYVAERAAGAGVRRLFYKELRGNQGQLWLNSDFCEACGFAPMTADERILYYEAENLKNNQRIAQVMEKSQKSPIEKLPRSYDNPRLRKLKKQINSQWFFLDQEKYDADYSWVYIQGDSIVAVCCVCTAGGDATLSGFYLSPFLDANGKKVVKPLLLVHSVHSVLEAGYQRIYLTMQGEVDHNAAIALFGEPDGTYYAIEWVKEI